MALSSSRPYQGYGYVHRPVINPPSISASEAARWNHLPRRQVELNVAKYEPNTQSIEISGSIPDKRESNPAVVYIDMPESSGSDVANRLELPQVSSRPDPDDEDPVPVVYIDMPDPTGSAVALSTTSTPQDGPVFVQETIFYNPFDNKMINRAEDSDDEGEPTHNHAIPARRPNTLDLYGAGAGSSAGGSTSYPSSSAMSKETNIYGDRDSSGFPVPPIPASQFPEPPPSYDDIDNTRPVVTQVVRPVEPPMLQPIPPRTQVILPGDSHRIIINNNTVPSSPMGVPNPDRKNLTCHHCGTRVHTLVIRENGVFTHIVGITCLIVCLPLMACVYCTNWFRIKNHYCPSCNKVIGYQLPIGDKMYMED